MKKLLGFTLLELMLALGIMSIGAVSLFKFQGFAARQNLASREYTVATQIAENWVERLKVDALNWNANSAMGQLTNSAG